MCRTAIVSASPTFPTRKCSAPFSHESRSCSTPTRRARPPCPWSVARASLKPQRMPSRLIEAAAAGRIVLAPSTELAAALVDAVERAHRYAGDEIWPTPKILDFGSWLKAQHLERQLIDSSLPRCLSDAEERELWRRVVLESAASAQFLEPAGAARGAQRARRATFEYGIPRGAIAAHGTEETQAFEAWRAAFESRCRELRVIGADELWAGLDRAADGDGRAAALTWIESPLWRPAARRWLERNGGAPLLPEEVSPS